MTDSPARAFPVAEDAFDRWIAGTAMVLAPPTLLAAVLTRFDAGLLFTAQLAAHAESPGRMTVSYTLFALGTVLLLPAVLGLARRIGATRRGWALWGGALVVLGLFTRTFHAGADYLAFQFADVLGVQAAGDVVGDTYGAFHVFRSFSVAIMFGWIVLAIGARLSGALGWVGAVGLGLMSALPLGVLKGATVFSLVAVGGLAVALVPLGLKACRSGPAPRAGTVARWIGLIVGVSALATVLGQLG
ncbi:hypothetical protein AB0I28_38455 [Phytomonospora sp. NPDC050363]|uniref:hypothetical protein n=1 Tax=Phytomonospora sp. NPDC050363 TaxID=3155642 RepID=UPI00340B37BA